MDLRWRGCGREYPEAIFLGEKHGAELARHYSSADVFVFPSKTDTFGLVMLEALACGTPVAAYPVTGPVDVIRSDEVGVLHTDLEIAAASAMSLRSDDCRGYALGFTWEGCARRLLGIWFPTNGIEQELHYCNNSVPE